MRADDAPTIELRSSLSEWRKCVERFAWSSSLTEIDAIFRNAFTDCSYEQERYRRAVILFDRSAAPLPELASIADELVAEKRVTFRMEMGERISSDIVTRRAIMRRVKRPR